MFHFITVSNDIYNKYRVSTVGTGQDGSECIMAALSLATTDSVMERDQNSYLQLTWDLAGIYTYLQVLTGTDTLQMVNRSQLMTITSTSFPQFWGSCGRCGSGCVGSCGTSSSGSCGRLLLVMVAVAVVFRRNNNDNF